MTVTHFCEVCGRDDHDARPVGGAPGARTAERLECPARVVRALPDFGACVADLGWSPPAAKAVSP